MTASFGTAIAMLEVVLSAILGAYLQPPANQATPPGKPRGTAPQTTRGRPTCPALPPSELPGAPPQAGPLPVQRERPARRPEMADVDALCVADPDPAGQRLMHVPEEQVTRPAPAHRIQQGLAAPLHSPGDRVVEQLGHGRRDVRA